MSKIFASIIIAAGIVSILIFLFGAHYRQEAPSEGALNIEATALTLKRLIYPENAVDQLDVAVSMPADADKILNYIERADKNIERSQSLKTDKERYILIEEILKYKSNLSLALEPLPIVLFF